MQNIRKCVHFFSQYQLLVSHKSNHKNSNASKNCVYWMFMVVNFYKFEDKLRTLFCVKKIDK